MRRPGRREDRLRPELPRDPDAAPLLDGELLRQLERLRYSTLTAIVAGLVGDRQGQARVAHLEFADHRPYVAGDELRRIDWNIYRRLHQLVVKVGIEDGRLSLALLVDVSRSMRMGEPSKSRAACRLAAALAAIALLRGDQADVHVLGDGRVHRIVRLGGPRQLPALLHELERLPHALGTGLEESLARYARGGAPTDVGVLISDANVPPDELGRALRALAASARTCVLLHVVAPDELQTRLRGAVELRDAESGRSFETAVDEQAATAYAERFAEFSASVREHCREAGVGYVQVRSDADPLDALLEHAHEAALIVV